MIQLPPSQVSAQLRALFDPDAPASLRCFAVLDGQSAGEIWCDTLPIPSFGMVREAVFGSLYFGGTPDAAIINAMIDRLKNQGDVLVGLWPEDDLWHILPPNPGYVGFVLEYTSRTGDETLSAFGGPVPEGCQLRHLDSGLFEHSMMANYFTGVYGSVEKALEQGIGLCLMRDGEILSEASAGPSANGLIEIGVETKEGHQRRGYATLVCAYLIQECEDLGLGTYWNCDSQNPASIALARKLGYEPEKKYRLAAWSR